MKIRNLTLKGFRGFNEKSEPIEFQESLTLFFGPNSYGKTSISEALEWLLFGITSKVEGAAVSNNKTEYQGSYRNCHFPENDISFVEATFCLTDNSEVIYRGELQKDDSIKKYIDSVEVDSWPWTTDIILDPRPFVLQHSLKSLLLTNPTSRYKGFTRLIGAEELDEFQEDFVSLCTKYHKPNEVDSFLASFAAIEQILTSVPELGAILRVFKKKPLDIEKLYTLVLSECANRVPKNTDQKDYLSVLKAVKDTAIKKVFDKNILLPRYSEAEQKEIQGDIAYFASVITEEFIKNYIELIALSTIQEIVKKSQLLDLCVDALEKDPKTCPLTASPLPDDCFANFRSQCELHQKEKENQAGFTTKQEKVLTQLQNLKQRLNTFHQRCLDKTSNFVKLGDQEVLARLETLLGVENKKQYDDFQKAVTEIKETVDQLSAAYEMVKGQLTNFQDSIDSNTEDQVHAQALGDAILAFLQQERLYRETVTRLVTLVTNVDQVLKNKLETLADTKELTALIQFLEVRKDLEKKVKIQNLLESLGELRKQVDSYVATKLQNVVKTSLSSDVMEWYREIKTQGDPDVHFEGFDFPQTKGGSVKARQIEVNAKSYDKRLPSAVSSLSESKLNALGLSISIANCVKGGNTFGFILIDDPVQSLDKGHSIQVVEVIRKLVVDHQKQVILLSHDREWLNLVRKQCRTLNGYFYEITSYSQKGPNLVRRPWAAISERFEEIRTLLNKPDGMSAMEKQRVADEFRILYHELTADIYQAKTGDTKNPDKFNGAIIRDLLIKSGMPIANVDQIDAAYTAVNAPHHRASYDEPTEKLREYLKYAEYLQSFSESLKAAAKLDKAASQMDKKKGK